MPDDSTEQRIGKRLSKLAEISDDRALDADERLRVYRLKRLARFKGFLALAEYATMIEQQDGARRQRAEADRASDAEIAAAAGLGRDALDEGAAPLDEIEDPALKHAPYDDKDGKLLDGVEPPGSPPRIAAELAPLADIIDKLRASRVPGFDTARPESCGPLWALLAEGLAKVDAEHNNLPDVVTARAIIATEHYNALRLDAGMEPAKSARRFERDLAYAKKTVRKAQTGKRLPRRGIQKRN